MSCVVILGGAVYADDPTQLTLWLLRVARDHPSVSVIIVDPCKQEDGMATPPNPIMSSLAEEYQLGSRYNFVRRSANDVGWDELLRDCKSVMFVDQLWGRNRDKWKKIREKVLGTVHKWYTDNFARATYWLPASFDMQKITRVPHGHTLNTDALLAFCLYIKHTKVMDPKDAIVQHWIAVGNAHN
jgi:hypothetical protein